MWKRMLGVVGALAVGAVTLVAVTVVPAGPAGAVIGCDPSAGVSYRAPGIPEFSFQRCGVPDYDQIRTALPNNGAMYCLPASAIDWMVYLADRGATSVMPGPSSSNSYASISSAMSSMGMLMSTDAFNGTKGDDAIDGLRAWFDQSLANQGADYFTVSSHYETFDHRADGVNYWEHPRGRDLAAAAATGSFVIPNIGWYSIQDGFMKQTGGHLVALAEAHPDLWTYYGSYTLGFNNPSSDDGISNDQGPWTTEPVAARSTFMDTSSGDRHGIDKLWAPGFSSGYLDGYLAITPKFGLFPDPASPGSYTFHRSINFDDGPGDHVLPPVDGRIIDIVLGADGASTTVLLDDGRIVDISTFDGSATTVATIPGATNIALDDQLRTAVIDSDGSITLLDRHHNPVTTSSVPGATGLEFSQRLDSFVTFDSADQALVALASDGGSIQQRSLPLAPDGPPISPQATLSVNPTTGIVGLLEPGSNQLLRTVASEGRFVTQDTITLGDGAPLEGLVADATGTWYSTSEGHVVAFDVDGNELPDNPFAGQPSGPGFAIFQPMDTGSVPDVPDVLPQDAPASGIQVDLAQATGTEAVGSTHDVVATLTDPDGAVLADRTVAFVVTGANPATGSTTTDADGRAVLSWTGTTAGDDTITAWVDRNDDGADDPDEEAASLAMSWTPPAVVATSTTLTASANPVPLGRRVTFTATVAGGTQPLTGSVRFTSDGVPLGAPVPLDEIGRATLSTKALTAGPHHVEATFTPDDASTSAPSTGQLEEFVGRYRFTADLVRNPGAEQRPGSSTGAVVRVPHWTTVTGAFTAVAYGAVDPVTGIAFPTQSAGPADAGANFFAGGPDVESTIAQQIVPLPTSTLASIDAGDAAYRFSAWLGGNGDERDLCEPVLVFTPEADGTGVVLGRDALLGGRPEERDGRSGFRRYSTIGRVPAGARSATVVLEMSRLDGTYNDGYCDSLSVTIGTPRP